MSKPKPFPVPRPVEGARGAPPLWLPDEPFPPYRFVPGHAPHPFAQEGGYAYGKRPPNPPPCAADDWRNNHAFLRGVDFFNRGWWWEAHEAWEGYWHAVEGVDVAQHDLMKGLIQLAASALNLERDNHSGAQKLLETATQALARAWDAAGRESLCGLDLGNLAIEANDRLTIATGPVRGFYLWPS